MTFLGRLILALCITGSTWIGFDRPVSADARFAGRWLCNSYAMDPRRKLPTIHKRYQLILRSGGQFFAGGFIRGSGGTAQFRAQGRWQIRTENGRVFLAAVGTEVAQYPGAPAYKQRHITFGLVNSLTRVTILRRPRTGSHYSLDCQKQ